MAPRQRIKPRKEPSDWLWGVFLIGLVLVAYVRVSHAGFIWDDEAHLTQNPVIVGPLGLKDIWTSTQAVYYPLVLTTFWVLHKMVGLAPAPYHILNVLIHGVNAVLLWRVLRELGVRGAWLGAALWALHPVMVQSVAWVTELKNTESCLFYLLSILLFLNLAARGDGDSARRWRWGLTVLLFALAIASKPSTVVMPAVLVLCLWWRNHRWRRRDLVVLAPFFLLSIAASGWTIWEQKFHSGATGLEWEQTWPERLIIAGRGIWFYLGKLVWPDPLIFIYPRWPIDSSQPVAYLPLLAAVTALSILWFKRKTWLRPVFFASAYFVISLFPILGLFNVYFFRYSFVSDHFQYLASIGPLALAGAGIASGLAALKWKPSMQAALCGLLLLVLGPLTWRQTAIYNDVFTLYQDTLEKNPACWMAYYNLAIAFRANGEIDQAIRHYREAVVLKPDYGEAHYNLARLLAEKGELKDAIDHYKKALAVNPDDAEGHNNLGATLFRAGRLEDAIAHYRQALQIRPDYGEASCNLADALFRLGRTEEAITCYEKGLQLRHEDADVRANFASALAQEGRMQEAIVQYRNALAINPKNVPAQSNLAWLLATSSEPSLRNGSEALRLAEMANRLSGGDQPVILRILAAARAENGDLAHAIQIAQRALELAKTADNRVLITAIEKEITLYQAGSAYHKVPH